MKIKILLTVVSSFIILPSAFGQGALTPPGAPAPTMKTLTQIEPRTAITNTASVVVIVQSGSYYLTGNLTVSSGNAIIIATNGVTLDLNGFTISSTAASASGYGIQLASGLSDLTIFNGHIRGGVTNNGSGVYAGSGFSSGIYFIGAIPVNAHVSSVSVSGCFGYGIYLGIGDSTLVEHCTVRTVGNVGISASTIKTSVAVDCGGTAIYGDQASDCRGESVAGNGIDTSSCALNCYGSSSSGYGVSTKNAQNCSGNSISGYGLSALTAQNCNGGSSSSYALVANTALNCFGSSNTGYGLYAGDVAIGCRGSSFSSTGLSAFIANACHGTSSTGTPLTTTHNVNSF